MPDVTTDVDGSQDALLVRVTAGDQIGWGECEASPLPSIAAFVCPMSHGACRPVGASPFPGTVVVTNMSARNKSIQIKMSVIMIYIIWSDMIHTVLFLDSFDQLIDSSIMFVDCRKIPHVEKGMFCTK